MPVTAKLSRKFYEQLGDEVANELVEWFNAVDSTYKSDMKELNELSWNRFRAELRSELDQHFSGIRREFDARFAGIDRRFATMDSQFAGIETRFALVDVKIADLRTELIKWMFLLWIGTIVPLGGLMVVLTQGLR
jgi:hypothetical protein